MSKPNQAAFDTGQLTHRLIEGYLMHAAMQHVASHPNARAFAPQIEERQIVPIGRLRTKDGFDVTYHFNYFLDLAKSAPEIGEELPRVWMVGAFLRIGDELSRNNYFDRAPELELLRHLRNGVAHGNRFHIVDPAKLEKYPAHNKLASVRSATDFEIVPGLDGKPVLFEFMEPADCVQLLHSISGYLIRMGNGDTLRP